MVERLYEGERNLLDKYKYTDEEQKKIINSMVVIVDSREKKNDHITAYFDKHRIKYERRTMTAGDYSFYIEANKELSIPRPIYFDKSIFIERKANLEELSLNLTSGRTRFEEEFSLNPKTKKYLLIENANYYDLVNGNYDSKYNSKAYLGSLHSFNHKYNLEIVFMPNNQFSAIYILGVFQYYLKNLIK